MILLVNYLFYRGIGCWIASSQAPRNDKKAISGLLLKLAMTIGVLLIWFVLGNMRMIYVREHSVLNDFKVSLVQGNIHQEIKWEETIRDNTFQIYFDLSEQARDVDEPNLIVFPEAALPVHLMIMRDYYRMLIDFVYEIQTPIFTGFPHAVSHIKYKGQNDPLLYFNAANLFCPENNAGEMYFKNILVPFGERTPFLDRFPILWALQMGQANFEHGEEVVIYEVDGFRFAPLICFEIAFPLFLRDIVKEHNPDFFVTITNDAWFYRSIGTHQHAIKAAFRTIETRKSIFRAANTGYSFYTTPDGKIHSKTDLFERTYITGNLWTYDTLTPYLSYGFVIYFIFFVFFALQITTILICWLSGKNKRVNDGENLL